MPRDKEHITRGSRGGRIGRPPTCTCGGCGKCRRREVSRARYQSLGPEERAALIARRDRGRVKANDRARYERHRIARLLAQREYKQTEAGRKASARAQDGYRDRYPEKYEARTAVNNAVRDGRLKKLPCEVCGDTERVDAHHEDYSQPFDVVWLCDDHHREKHGKRPKLRLDDAA